MEDKASCLNDTKTLKSQKHNYSGTSLRNTKCHGELAFEPSDKWQAKSILCFLLNVHRL